MGKAFCSTLWLNKYKSVAHYRFNLLIPGPCVKLTDFVLSSNTQAGILLETAKMKWMKKTLQAEPAFKDAL